MPICATHSAVDIGAVRPAALMWPLDAGRTWTDGPRRADPAAGRATAVPPARAVAPTASSASARTVERGPAVTGCVPMGLLGGGVPTGRSAPHIPPGAGPLIHSHPGAVAPTAVGHRIG